MIRPYRRDITTSLFHAHHPSLLLWLSLSHPGALPVRSGIGRGPDRTPVHLHPARGCSHLPVADHIRGPVWEEAHPDFGRYIDGRSGLGLYLDPELLS